MDKVNMNYSEKDSSYYDHSMSNEEYYDEADSIVEYRTRIFENSNIVNLDDEY